MRLDTYLVAHQLAPTRSQAADYIRRGEVSIDGKVVSKPAYEVKENEQPVILARERFVSRAGEKLSAALEEFHIDLSGSVALDIGSSTGGFTHCLLERGVASVTCVDVGTAQLAPALRHDPRVTVFETTDIRSFESEKLFDCIVVDVSFISVLLLIPSIKRLAAPRSRVIILIKPQFEVGKDALGKDGVVRDSALQMATVQKVQDAFQAAGFEVQGCMESPITGGSGNREWLLYLINRT